jgi:hypothetical protein
MASISASSANDDRGDLDETELAAAGVQVIIVSSIVSLTEPIAMMTDLCILSTIVIEHL